MLAERWRTLSARLPHRPATTGTTRGRDITAEAGTPGDLTDLLLDRSRVVRHDGQLNCLSTEQRARIIGSLVEGNSIRATVRMTGAAKNTVTKLLVGRSGCGGWRPERVRRVAPRCIKPGSTGAVGAFRLV